MSTTITRYKYLPFDEGSLKTLSESTIKYTNPTSFNDPFDCLPFYDTSNLKNLHKLRPDLYRAVVKELGLSPAQAIQQRGKLIAHVKRAMESGEYAKSMITDIGVVSLSRTGVSIPMWSHYAGFHSGFVLEFQIPVVGPLHKVKKSNELLVPLEVHYQHDRPVVHFEGQTNHELLQKIALTKSNDWKYEEEERVIDQTRGPGIHKYSRNEVLKSVFFGLKMDPDHKRRIQDEIDAIQHQCKHHINTYNVSAYDDKYKLYVPGHSTYGG